MTRRWRPGDDDDAPCRCGKIRHETRSDARRHLKRLKASGKTDRDRRRLLETYWCHRCGGYHVGHGRPRRERLSPVTAAEVWMGKRRGDPLMGMAV